MLQFSLGFLGSFVLLSLILFLLSILLARPAWLLVFNLNDFVGLLLAVLLQV